METFKKQVASYDASNLPPCARELRQQILRTAYISNMWSNSFQKNPSLLDPLNYGWCLNDNGQYTFNWFEGPETPESIQDIVLKSTGI